MAKLFIISGVPSTGSGKDSVIEGLKKEKLDFNWIITATTRVRRVGETEGHPYYFITVERFLTMKKRGEFLEWAKVYGNYYGSTKQQIKQSLQQKKPALLRIDYQGVKKYRKLIPEAIVILITVSSLKILESRLIQRGDDKKIIKQRLLIAKKELKNMPPHDYLVENREGKLIETIQQVKKIILQESK